MKISLKIAILAATVAFGSMQVGHAQQAAKSKKGAAKRITASRTDHGTAGNASG